MTMGDTETCTRDVVIARDKHGKAVLGQKVYTRATKLFCERTAEANVKLGLKKVYYDLPGGKRGYRWGV